MPHKQGTRTNRLWFVVCCFFLATALGASSVQAQRRTQKQVRGSRVNTDSEFKVNVDLGSLVNADLGSQVRVDLGSLVNTDLGSLVNTDLGSLVNTDLGSLVNTDLGSHLITDLGSLVNTGTNTGLTNSDISIGSGSTELGVDTTWSGSHRTRESSRVSGLDSTSLRSSDVTPALQRSHIKEKTRTGSIATLDVRLESSYLPSKDRRLVRHLAELARRREIHKALVAADKGNFTDALRHARAGRADNELIALLQVGHYLSRRDPAFRPVSEVLEKAALLDSSHKKLILGIYKRGIAGAIDRRSFNDVADSLSPIWVSNIQSGPSHRLAHRWVTGSGYLGPVDASPNLAASSLSGAPRANIVSVSFLASAPASVPRPESLLLETNWKISKVKSPWRPSDYRDFISTASELSRRSMVSVCTGEKCSRPPQRLTDPRAVCAWKCSARCPIFARSGNEYHLMERCLTGEIRCGCGGYPE